MVDMLLTEAGDTILLEDETDFYELPEGATRVHAAGYQVGWDVRARIDGSSLVTYDVRERRDGTAAVAWDVRDRLAGSQAVSWDVRERLAGSFDVLYDLRERRDGAAAVAWNVRERRHGGGTAELAVVARHTANTGTLGVTETITDTHTPTANSRLLIFQGAEQDGDGFTLDVEYQPPSGGGLTYEFVGAVGDDLDYIPWVTNPAYRISAAMWTAEVGASPSPFAITVRPYPIAGSGQAYQFVLAADITGLADDDSDPVQSAMNGGSFNPQLGPSDAGVGSVTLGSSPEVGNVVFVCFAAGTGYDGINTGGGGFATPEAGAGKTFIEVHNQDAHWPQGSMWYRVWDGTEDDTITCAAVGYGAGNWVSGAVEFPAAAPTGVTWDVRTRVAGAADLVTWAVRERLNASSAIAWDVRERRHGGGGTPVPVHISPGNYLLPDSAAICTDTTNVAVAADGKVVALMSWYGDRTLDAVAGGGLDWEILGQTGGSTYKVAVATADAPAGLASGIAIVGTLSGGAFARFMTLVSVGGLDDLDGTYFPAHFVSPGDPPPRLVDGVVTTSDDSMVFLFQWLDFMSEGSAPTSPAAELFDMNTGGGAYSFYYQDAPAAGVQTISNNIDVPDRQATIAAFAFKKVPTGVTWDVRARIDGQHGVDWDVRERIDVGALVLYDVRHRRAGSRAVAWNVRKRLNSSELVYWNTFQSMFRVHGYFDVEWDTRQRVDGTHPVLYDTGARINAGRLVTWDTRKRLSGLLEPRWDVRERRHVGSQVLYVVRERIDGQHVATWSTRQRHNVGSDVRWDVFVYKFWIEGEGWVDVRVRSLYLNATDGEVPVRIYGVKDGPLGGGIISPVKDRQP